MAYYVDRSWQQRRRRRLRFTPMSWPCATVRLPSTSRWTRRNAVSGVAGTQVVQAAHAIAGQDRGLDARAVLGGQFLVEQLDQASSTM